MDQKGSYRRTLIGCFLMGALLRPLEKVPIMRTLLSLLVFCGSCFASALAWSQAAPTPRVVFPSTVVGNVISLGVATADAANAANFSFGAAANGAVFANTGTRLATAGGSSVDIAVAGAVAKAPLIAALGRFAAKTLPFVNVGLALYDLGKELGYTSRERADGSLEFVARVDTSQCDSIPQSYQTASQSWCAGNGNPGGLASYGIATANQCNVDYVCSNGTTLRNATAVSRIASTIDRVVTPEQLTSDAAAKIDAGPPSTGIQSVLPRLIQDILKAGEALPVSPQALTGPASQPVSSSTSVNPSTNTTTTTNVTQNYNYGPNTVTVTTTTTGAVTNNTTGAVSPLPTTTDATAQPTAPLPPAITCGLPNTPPCKIDESGTPAYDKKTMELDKTSLDAAAKSQRDTISGVADKTMFDGWRSLFTLPALRSCEPVPMPVYMGQQLASMDICPGAEWLRGLMGFVWAAAGFAFTFRTVQGAI